MFWFLKKKKNPHLNDHSSGIVEVTFYFVSGLNLEYTITAVELKRILDCLSIDWCNTVNLPTDFIKGQTAAFNFKHVTHFTVKQA